MMNLSGQDFDCSRPNQLVILPHSGDLARRVLEEKIHERHVVRDPQPELPQSRLNKG